MPVMSVPLGRSQRQAKNIEALGGGGKPTVIRWKGENMMRAHSIRAVAKRILHLSKALDLVKINIIGPPSTGKSELLYALAHLMHTNKTVPYTVKYFTREELLDMEKTVKGLNHANYILGFDDISFLGATSDSQRILKMQKVLSEIRHLTTGDVKVVCFFLFHYGTAVPPFLRQSNMWFYTEIGSEELKHALLTVGRGGTRRVHEFRRLVHAAQNTDKFGYKLGKKQQFTYKYRKPFAPVLCFDGDRTRHAVYPMRTWIQPACDQCNSARHKPQSQLNMREFKRAVTKRFGESTVKTALRQILWTLGYAAYRDEVNRCIHWTKEYTKECDFDPKVLAAEFGLPLHHYAAKRHAHVRSLPVPQKPGEVQEEEGGGGGQEPATYCDVDAVSPEVKPDEPVTFCSIEEDAPDVEDKVPVA